MPTSGADVLTLKENGNVGIGTTSPDTNLHVDGGTTGIIRVEGGSYVGLYVTTIYGDIVYLGQGFSNEGYLALYEDGVLNIKLRARADEESYFNGGYVGIGTTNPASRLEVANGCITGSFCSDRRLKKNIHPVASESMLEKVATLQASAYQWNDSEDDKTYIGLIAQDVEQVLPEVVSTPMDGSAGKGLYCNGLNTVTIEAIKELKGLVEAQQKRIDLLESKLAELQ